MHTYLRRCFLVNHLNRAVSRLSVQRRPAARAGQPRAREHGLGVAAQAQERVAHAPAAAADRLAAPRLRLWAADLVADPGPERRAQRLDRLPQHRPDLPRRLCELFRGLSSRPVGALPLASAAAAMD